MAFWDTIKKWGEGAVNLGTGGAIGQGLLPNVTGVGSGAFGARGGGGSAPAPQQPGYGQPGQQGGYPGYNPAPGIQAYGGQYGYPAGYGPQPGQPATGTQGSPQQGSPYGFNFGADASAFFGSLPGQPGDTGQRQPPNLTTGQGGAGGSGPGQAGSPHSQSGIDRINPGIMEQFGDQAMPMLMDPGSREQYWNQVQGQFNAPRGNVPGPSNRAEEAYKAFNDSGITAGLDPYYDNQRRKATEGIDQAMAARGMFGSSAALDQTSEALTNLGAEQANREGDFRLNALATGGQLGRGADISSGAQATHGLANEQNRLNWLTGGSQLAGQGDAGLLGRIGAGSSIASGAQHAREGRLQGAFDNSMLLGDRMAGITQPWMQGQIGGDQAAMDAAMAMRLGISNEALQQDRFGKQDFWNDAQNTSSLMGGIMGFM
jgi:hypothetical protein